MTDHFNLHPFVIEGARLRSLIENAHRLLGKRFKGEPLWSLVSTLTGHGSTMSCELLKSVGLDACQPCGSKKLISLESKGQP